MTDIADRHHDAPIDQVSREALAAQGLDLRLVPRTDAERFAAWQQALSRGFFEPEQNDKQREAAFERHDERRLVGAYDPASPQPDWPVATFGTFVADLSLPGGRSIPSCAITEVTVAPTHRRRGIMRSMMEGELRAARETGLAVAMLTASESTIYGRFGFASAALGAHVKIEVPRVRWIGERPGGRVDFVSRERARELVPALHARASLTRPGEITMQRGHWDRLAGTRPDAEHPETLRALQYASSDGSVDGVAVYTAEEDSVDFTKSKVRIHALIAATADAYAALWRHFLEMDLIGQVTASELAVDEPVLWMIGDRRAATVTVRDHQYVRILDVREALEARRYATPGALVLEVTDPLGFAEGTWHLSVDDDGRATGNAATDGETRDAVRVRLGITELSAAYLGSVSLATLAAAGRVQATDAIAAATLFAWPETARLSFWY